MIEKDGLYTLSINTEGDKTAKTKSAIRMIPVHKTLVELGFIDYYNHVKKLKHSKLFPALKANRDGDCARKVSRFFNSNYKNSTGGLIEYAGITKSTPIGMKVFHSLRHTFINQWKQQQLNDNLIKQIVGHSTDDITYNVYGKPYELKIIHKEINKIDFDIKLPRKWSWRFY